MCEELEKVELLLYTCDLEFKKLRSSIVTTLKSTETGLEDREAIIREQLRQIAILEMQKGKDEDEMLDQTLKTIEIVNIQDMATEKENLEASCSYLASKKAELDKIEEDLLKDKAKKDARRNTMGATSSTPS